MAKYANDFGEERWVPLIGKLLTDEEEFEVDDSVARQNDFSAFREIEPPAPLEPPADDAPRGEWVEHAVEHFGARREALEPLDRTDLIERFGVQAPAEIVPPSVDAPREVWVEFVAKHTEATAEDLEDFDRADLIEAVAPIVPAMYDPAGHLAKDVVDHLTTVDDAERERIITAEKAGKNRTTIVGEPVDDNPTGQE